MAPDSPIDVARVSGESPILVRRLKQLTAIITALTAFVAGTTALVVAAKAGWSEVGPYFGNLITHGETEISKSKPITKNSSPIEPGLILDLNNENREKRNEARKALAAAIAAASPEAVGSLIQTVSSSRSYREQLGVAVALAAAPGGWSTVSNVNSVDTLETMRDRSNDATLRSTLERAIRAAR